MALPLPVTFGVPRALHCYYIDDVRYVVTHSSIKINFLPMTFHFILRYHVIMIVAHNYRMICYVFIKCSSSDSLPKKCKVINISNKRSSMNIDYYIGSHPVLCFLRK